MTDEIVIKKGGDLTEKREAHFSPCEKYRYLLKIVWDESKPLCQFIGLNPSTADEMKDDPTLRRCKAFARGWGYGGLLMTNLFAFRATDPNDMRAAPGPVGAYNDAYLIESAAKAKRTVCAWGNHGSFLIRYHSVKWMLKDCGAFLECFKLTQTGQPQHPLYMAANTPLQRFG